MFSNMKLSKTTLLGVYLILLCGILICFLPSSITVDEDGLITVHFNWMNKSYEVGRSERKTVVCNHRSNYNAQLDGIPFVTTSGY